MNGWTKQDSDYFSDWKRWGILVVAQLIRDEDWLLVLTENGRSTEIILHFKSAARSETVITFVNKRLIAQGYKQVIQ